jgi:hypothetical protein
MHRPVYKRRRSTREDRATAAKSDMSRRNPSRSAPRASHATAIRPTPYDGAPMIRNQLDGLRATSGMRRSSHAAAASASLQASRSSARTRSHGTTTECAGPASANAAPPRRSSCLREIDPRSRRSSLATTRHPARRATASASELEWWYRLPANRQLPTMASASISTSHRGSRNPWTTMKPEAGRMSPKISPCTLATTAP